MYMDTKQRVLAGVTALTLPAMFAGILIGQAAPPAQTQNFGFAHPAFQRVWERTGLPVAATLNPSGTVGNDPGMTNMTGTKIAYYDTVTKHNIPQVFWDFLNNKGPVMVNGQQGIAQLSDPWFYASGRPISEAYWTK